VDDKTKTLLDVIEARWRKTTPGPIDVHRIDNQDGTISYQLQQGAGAPRATTDRDPIGARVLTQFDDLDNPDARWDADACAKAYEDVPALIALVKEQATENAALRALVCSTESNENWRAEVLDLRNRLAKVEGPPAPGMSNTRLLVLHKRDDAPWAVYPFETFTEARIAYEQFASSWTGTFLVRIVMGPDEEVRAERPFMPRIFDELMGELRAARERIAALGPDAEAWRKGHDVLRELRERVIPCGHKVEDLIGGANTVTKCGACLAARQTTRSE
jgi:hypothetical protein